MAAETLPCFEATNDFFAAGSEETNMANEVASEIGPFKEINVLFINYFTVSILKQALTTYYVYFEGTLYI